jgi:glycosyltransferase involved in cell wall biosynthesis
MNRSRPLVSIGIPTYNSERFLRETLESIAAQTWPDCEVIISDNASTDETLAIVEPFVSRHGWRLLTSDSNRGPFGNWNRLIESATGDYLAIYHADDLYDPEIVAESVRLLESSPAVGLVGTLATVIDDTGRERYPVMLPEGVGPTGSMDFTGLFRAVLGNGGDRIILVTPSIMVRRQLYLDLGGFDAAGTYGSAGDYEMWLRIAARHPVSVIPRPLVRYRIHEGQGSERELRRNLELPDLLAVLEAYAPLINDLDLHEEYDRYRSRTFLKTALKQNCAARFDRSSMTLGMIRSGRYLPPGLLLGLANRLRFNLRCWPGRSWPSRIPMGDE